MRLSPLLLGLAALGFGWASPVLAQDGADCGFLCQLGGYLSTDHMTASPGDAAAGGGAPAKARKTHAAHRAPAKPASQEAAHGAPTAAEHVAAKAVPETRTDPDAKVGVKIPATQGAAARVLAAKADGGKAGPAKAAIEPAVRKPAPDGPKAQVAVSHPDPAPGTRIPARTASKASAKPAVVATAEAPTRRVPAALKAVPAQTATSTPDHGHARKQADRPGGSVEIASASAVPSPSTAAVAAKPVRTARAALPRRAPATAAQPDRPVIVLTALAAIPGSAPAISAGFQPAVVTAH